MLGRDKVDVVTAAILQAKHQLGDLIGRAFVADRTLAYIPVLTEDTLQVAEAEEDCARAEPASEAVLLAKMRKCARNAGVATCVTDLRLTSHPIDVAVARAGTTVFQLTMPSRNSIVKLARGHRKVG